MKLIILIMSLILLSISVSISMTLGISPEKLEFSDNTNEAICNNFSVIGDDDSSLFEGDVLWSRSESRNILDHKINSSSLGINAEFPALINAGKYQICITSKKSGNYYGALLYKLKGSSYGVGTWIDLDVKKESFNGNFSLLSGQSIKNINPTGTLFIASSALLSIALVFLIIKLRRKKELSSDLSQPLKTSSV